MKLELFAHNQTAYEAAEELLARVGRAAIVHPTGTGKSFIGFKLCEQHPDSRVCWLSPSEYIFRTQVENLRKACGAAPDTEILKNVRFLTYARLMGMGEEELEELRPAYIILDEFHRCGAQMWGQGVQRLLGMYPGAKVLGLSATSVRYLDNQRDMAQELFDGNVASEMTLGEAVVRGILSPPKYIAALYSCRKDLEHYLDRVKTIRNRKQRDEAEAYLEALRRALEKADGLDVIFEKHLPDPHGKYLVFCANAEHMGEMKGLSGDWFGRVDKAPHIYSVYSEDPGASSSFAAFKEDNDTSHLRLLYCIDALNEGIHVEGIDGVILLRPTVSPIIYKQQIGRALAAGKKKEPVIFDIVNNIAGLYSISSLEEEMKEVVRYYQLTGDGREIVNESFRIIDEVRDCRKLFEELETVLSASWDYMYVEAKNYYEEHGDLLPLQGYVTEDGLPLGQWVVTQRNNYRRMMNASSLHGVAPAAVSGKAGRAVTGAPGEVPEDVKPPLCAGLTAARIRKLEAIGMVWQTMHERQWEEKYLLARAYYEAHGDLLPTREEDPSLTCWLVRQRQKQRDGQLEDWQFARLSVLGMVWEFEDSWEQKFALAEQYYEKHGNLDIPADYETEDGVKLGAWYRGVLSQYKDGTLTEERKRRLEAIGIQWESVLVRNWSQYYSLAEGYYREHGDLNVPTDYETGGVKLGVWISGQRHSRKTGGNLTEEQIHRLDRIGMSWQRFPSKWDAAYGHAEAYHDEHGVLDAPAGYRTGDGFALGAWLASQRRKYAAGKLKPMQVRKLEALDITWDVQGEAWERGYRHALAYYGEHGDLDAGGDYVSGDGYRLGTWLKNQRNRKKGGRMTEEQRQRLEALGMVWDAHAAKWDRGYAHAASYRRGAGHARIPQTYVTGDGYPLGEWVRSQERRYRKGALEAEKIEKLAQIGIVFGGG